MIETKDQFEELYEEFQRVSEEQTEAWMDFMWLFYRLRTVARAADRLLKEHPTWLTQEETSEALDALPQWVLDTEDDRE